MTTITTSWDDGHPLDERLAEQLTARGLAATFYVPTRCDRPVCDAATLRRIAALGCEIGGHTTSHRVLTRLSDAEALGEMRDNRRALEDQLGTPVTSFCYPCGHFSRRLMRLARTAGFHRARTTMGLRHDAGGDPFALPVTVQCYPHGRGVHLRHALKEANLRGLRAWAVAGLPAAPHDVLSQALTERDAIVHLWGHSWELEECGLWPLLTTLIELLATAPGARHAVNAVAYAGASAAATQGAS
jgi:peptidoglycan-N-acetylglucosamine deacetylase